MKNLNKKRIALLTACVVSAVGHMAFAAEADNYDEYSGADYVVTATKTQLEKKEVPQSVEVITREEIQNMGAITMQDALRTATNFEITDAGMVGNSLSMRGGSSSDILILLNGRRIPGEGSGGQVMTNTYVLSRLNVANVERIEILRGPVGAIYGSEAKDGVVNIITKKADKASTTIGVATGTRVMSNYYHFDTGKQGKVSAVFDANFSKNRYFKYKNAGASLYTGPRQNYSLYVDYEMDEDNKLNFYTDYENTDQEALYLENAMSGMPLANPYWSPYKVDRKSMALTYDGKRSNHNFSFAANYGILKKDSGSAAGPTVSHSEYESWQFEGKDTIDLDKNNRLTFGAEYKKEGRTDGSVDKKAGQYSYFLHDELRVGDKLLVIPAIRLDKHDEFGDYTSPSLGATYSFTDNNRLKVNYGKGFRAPTVFELYGVMRGMFNIGNPDLKPERSEGYEISYEQEWDKTNAKLTYFKTDKKDAIELSGATMLDMKYKNIAEATAKGVEFEIKQDLSNGFTLTGNYDWLDSVDKTTGERNYYSAKNTFMLKLGWVDPANTGWSVEAWNKWYSNYRTGKTVGSTTVPVDESISLFNVVVNKRWGEKYRAYIGVDNVFNKENLPMYYSGRTWRVGAEMTF